MTSADVAKLEDSWRKLLYELKTAPEKARELAPGWYALQAREALDALRERVESLAREEE